MPPNTALHEPGLAANFKSISRELIAMFASHTQNSLNAKHDD